MLLKSSIPTTFLEPYHTRSKLCQCLDRINHTQAKTTSLLSLLLLLSEGKRDCINHSSIQWPTPSKESTQKRDKRNIEKRAITTPTPKNTWRQQGAHRSTYIIGHSNPKFSTPSIPIILQVDPHLVPELFPISTPRFQQKLCIVHPLLHLNCNIWQNPPTRLTRPVQESFMPITHQQPQLIARYRS